MNVKKTYNVGLISIAFIALTACSGTETRSQHSPVPETNPQIQPSNAFHTMADKLAAQGNHTAAIALYRQILASNDNVKTREALAKSLIAIGNYSSAEKLLRSSQDDSGTPAETAYLLGKIYLSNGHFDKALSSFNQATQLSPSNEQYQSGRAIALAAFGKTEEAIASFGRSSNPKSLSNKALIYAASNQADVAITILEPLVTNNLVGVNGRQNLVFAYLMNGQEKRAYKLARIDLDETTLNDTFIFYRSLKNYKNQQRLQALVTGVANPSWDRQEAANLKLINNTEGQNAAARIIAQPAPEAAPEKPEPEPVKYELKEIPPLVEPEGWALQIGAYRTIEKLMQGWSLLYNANEDILSGIPPRRSEINFGDTTSKPHGFYYRLNAGPLKSMAHARKVCAQLKERGTDCWIRPPEKSEGTLPKEGS